MLETIIVLLIKLCILALVIYLILWVVEAIGIPIPPMVIKIIWIIVALIAILFIVRALPGVNLKL